MDCRPYGPKWPPCSSLNDKLDTNNEQLHQQVLSVTRDCESAVNTVSWDVELVKSQVQEGKALESRVATTGKA